MVDPVTNIRPRSRSLLDNKMHVDDFYLIRSLCSWCFCVRLHTRVEKNWVRRDVYVCKSCLKRTLFCRLCNNMAKGTTTWDDELCTVCDGTYENELNRACKKTQQNMNLENSNTINISSDISSDSRTSIDSSSIENVYSNTDFDNSLPPSKIKTRKQFENLLKGQANPISSFNTDQINMAIQSHSRSLPYSVERHTSKSDNLLIMHPIKPSNNIDIPKDNTDKDSNDVLDKTPNDSVIASIVAQAVRRTAGAESDGQIDRRDRHSIASVERERNKKSRQGRSWSAAGASKLRADDFADFQKVIEHASRDTSYSKQWSELVS